MSGDLPANAEAAVELRRGTGAVRGKPLPVFAGVLGLVIVIRLIARRRNS